MTSKAARAIDRSKRREDRVQPRMDNRLGIVKAVCVGLPRDVNTSRGAVRTGIFKKAVDGRVAIHGTTLKGDGQADLDNHGGVNKAIYGYPFEHYAFFAQALSRDDFEMGQFGENLTFNGISEDGVALGDVVQIGSATLKVAQPRQPCAKLGLRMNDPSFPKRFLASGRLGIYFSVVEAGNVGAGDTVERIERANDPVSLRDVWRATFGDARDDTGLARRILAFDSLGPEWRRVLQRR